MTPSLAWGGRSSITSSGGGMDVYFVWGWHGIILSVLEVFTLFKEGPRIARLAADIFDLHVRTARGTGPIAIVACIVPGKFRIQKQFRIVRRKRIITNALPREQQLHVIMSTGASSSFATVMEERDGYDSLCGGRSGGVGEGVDEG